ncbi:DUF6711 family protein [Clostridium beijerinckii]|uniref:Prophage protein n=1 Tax=Clostridium beijerinckii TaxID=1520 RepID=A0AAE5LS55_CLOBE|nr:DUF6711 family protein [Clostridium beijerinckii]NSB16452.1 hypothetical protein [Clostridium beijerinckii]OOM25657.1 hypothetical protein CLOBE_34520 [Clostridium beijerinckii]
MLKVNGVEITAPKTYQPSINDIDGETNRNANGELIRDRIATKRKLEMEWGPLTQEESSALLNAVDAEFFECTFPDPKDGMITKTMYVGDRTAPAYLFDEDSQEMRWKGLKMNFIEK